MDPQTVLYQLITSRMEEKKHIILGIDGRSGAGKSTMAQLLSQKFDAAVIHMDDFFLPPERKTPERLAQPGGNSDRERFETEVLARLAGHGDFSYNAYDCHTGAMRPVEIKAKRLSVIEGAYCLHPAIAGYYDIRVLMDILRGAQKGRILARNGEKVAKRFLSEWIPLENEYIEKLNIRGSCDIVLLTE